MKIDENGVKSWVYFDEDQLLELLSHPGIVHTDLITIPGFTTLFANIEGKFTPITIQKGRIIVRAPIKGYYLLKNDSTSPTKFSKKSHDEIQ